MKIVTTTAVFPAHVTPEDAIRRLAHIGYEGIDFNFTTALVQKDAPMEEYLAWASSLRALADDLGVTIRHAHAPADVEMQDERMHRCFAVAQVLGVKYMVIHPINLDFTEDREALEDEEKFIAWNVAAMPQLLAWAEEYEVTVLTENLPWSAGKDFRITDRLLKTVNHPRFGWCYDTGHANILSRDAEEIVGLTPPLSLHIHDNFRGHFRGGDRHTLPGEGDIDFAHLFDALRRAGYAGDFVLEACHESAEAKTDKECDAILTELLRRARLMRNAIVLGTPFPKSF